MTKADYEAATRLIADRQDLIFYRGQPISKARVEEAEMALGIRIPPTYRQFLADFGKLGFAAEEFYGVSEVGAVTDPTSYAVWLTLDLRAGGFLPSQTVIVGQDGMGGEYIIDLRQTAHGSEGSVVYWHSGRSEPGDELEVLADDFGAFLRQEVEAAIARHSR